MKKFISGLACGVIFSMCTVAFAGNSIQAILFPVKYIINGQTTPLDNGYETLNYNGHAYVPIRFIGEKLGSSVNYDGTSQTIAIQSGAQTGNTHFIESNIPGISIGNLVLTKEQGKTNVTGQLQLKGFGSSADIKGRLSFYDQSGNEIGFAVINQVFQDGIQSFTVTGDGDFTSYATAGMNVGALNGSIINRTPAHQS